MSAFTCIWPAVTVECDREAERVEDSTARLRIGGEGASETGSALRISHASWKAIEPFS